MVYTRNIQTPIPSYVINTIFIIHFREHLQPSVLFISAGFSDPYCMLGIVPGSRSGPRDRQIDGSVSSDEECSSPKPRRDRSALKKFSQVRGQNHNQFTKF